MKMWLTTSLIMAQVAFAVLAATPKQISTDLMEVELAWAETNSIPFELNEREAAWSGYWRNRAGAVASDLTVARLQEGPKAEAANAPVTSSPQSPSSPPPPADPNAAFRAAPTPEENLARVPPVKVNTENDYVPKLRPGERPGITVDYAGIESQMRRYPEASAQYSAVSIIPPVYGWSGGWGGWGSGRSWGGPAWASGGHFGFGYPLSHWPYGHHGHHFRPAPCVYGAPVFYDPYWGGGVSGGFFYRGRHTSVGVGFSF